MRTTDTIWRIPLIGWTFVLVIIALVPVFALDGRTIKSQSTWLVGRPVSWHGQDIPDRAKASGVQFTAVQHVHHDEEHRTSKKALVASRIASIGPVHHQPTEILDTVGIQALYAEACFEAHRIAH